jgi:transcriptional regulator with XRE-family HTH domain
MRGVASTILDIMGNQKTDLTTPIPVRHAMRKLGQDIRDARLRRRISTDMLAERASISRMTLYNVERGDVNVSVGSYATILFVLGMIDRLKNLADASEDTLGRQLEEERLPKRIRTPRKKESPPEKNVAI